MESFVIDCDSTPTSPIFNYKVLENRMAGKVEWNRIRYNERKYLVASERKKIVKQFSFEDFRNEVGGRVVMNACVLNWLMINPSQVPPFWDNRTVVFFGTIYDGKKDRRFVRSLFASKGKCTEKYISLDDEMLDKQYAAVFE